MKWAQDDFTGKRFGKYKVLCRLAVGGMAEIFLAFPRAGDHLAEPVVLKRILAEQREDEQALQMLLDEAKLTATLNHLNVARVLDLEVDGEEVLLVIEFIAGANMEELVASYTEKQEPVPLGLALSVIREAAQGLDHAHSQADAKGKPAPIVHRDVTPRNIMLEFSGVTKMLDFGIARAMGTQRRTVAGMVRGTTAYMSPEQAVGKDVNPQSDIFSLGIIFHELLTGQRLFSRPNPGDEMAAVYEGEIIPPSRLNRRVPKALDAVVMRALERARDKRYQTGLELIRDISLTAGSTAWSHERCAEAIRERFSSRQREIQKLVASIPAVELGVLPKPSIPEARTLIAPINRQTGLPMLPEEAGAYDRDAAKTMMADPPPVLRPPVSMRVTDPDSKAVDAVRKPWRPVPVALGEGPDPVPQTRPLQPRTDPGVHSDAVTKEDVQPVARRKKSPSDGPARGRPAPVSRARPVPEAAVEAPTSKAPLIIVGLVAIALGILGGVLISKQVATNRAMVLGRVSLDADRPVQVLLGDQTLGSTPLSGVMLPVGRHQLVLKEAKGPKRALELTVSATQETRVEVVLDSLPKVP